MIDLYEILFSKEALEAWKKSVNLTFDPSSGSAVLMCAGEFRPVDIDADPAAGDLLIAVDGGLTYLEEAGKEPDLLLGDFDSLEENKDEYYKDFAQTYPERLLKLPVMKDDTDTMAAVRLVLSLGFKKIRLYGACGGRLDHMMANIATALYAKKHGAEVTFLNADSELFVLGPGDEKKFPEEMEGMFSLFPLTDEIEGVNIRGMHYNLTDGKLSNDFPLGEGNEIGKQFLTGKRSRIEVRSAGENEFTHNGEKAGSDAYDRGCEGQAPGKQVENAFVGIAGGYALAILYYKVEKKTREY